MKCNQAQEYILTDYLDGELDSKIKSELEEHLLECSACEEVLQEVKATAEGPFKSAEKPELDKEAIWNRIENQIEKESVRDSAPDPFKTIFEKVTSIPRPALASLATAAIVLVAALQFYPAQTPTMIPMVQTTEDYSYLTEVMDELTFDAAEEEEGYGTAIETYFL